MAFDMQSASQVASNQWNEDKSPKETSPQDTIGATPSKDFGTGVRGGVGYMGLSSASTLLRAIQVFAPVNSNALASAHEGFGGAEHSSALATWDASKQTIPSRSMSSNLRTQTRLPPASEIGPLVDCYFRYFR
jgi:hypothetical protein